MKIGKVEKYIYDKLDKDGALHFTLVDPEERGGAKKAIEMAKKAESAGTDAIMIGGTVGIRGEEFDNIISSIKKNISIPLILFPGDVSGVSKYADAIFFMSLMNSRNPYYITGAQALASMTIKKSKIEPISMAYLITEPGQYTAAGWVGDVKPFPKIKPYLAASYALSAEFMGFKLIYLEAGSGSSSSVPNEIIKATRSLVSLPIIVGGGVRTPKIAGEKIKAGANIIVTGTIVEQVKDIEKTVSSLVKEIKKNGKKR